MSADVEMTFMEHLEELRTRILHCLYAIFPAVMIAFYFAEPMLAFLTRHARTIPGLENKWSVIGWKLGISPTIGPFLLYDPPHSHSILVGLTPTEMVMSYMKIAFVAALFFVLPWIMYQVWKFVEPGLKQNEKKFLAPFILSAWLSFILGGVFAWYVMLEIAVPFLASFGSDIAQQTWSIKSYVSFTLTMILVFGIMFELPVVCGLLAILGLVTPGLLWKNIRYAILFIFIAAAILTPPDPITQTLLAIPLIILYLISIGVVMLLQRKPPTDLVTVNPQDPPRT